MKPFIVFSLVTTLAGALLVAAQDAPKDAPQDASSAAGPATSPTPEHRWLQQHVGEWESVTKMLAGPDLPEAETRSLDRVRKVGEFWTLTEAEAAPGGSPFTAVLTLGYDPEKASFVGTWIDSTSSMLWHYTGKLDEAGQALTLETEGPLPWDPSARGRYREIWEFQGPDHRTFTSTVQKEDGTWMPWVKTESRRKGT